MRVKKSRKKLGVGSSAFLICLFVIYSAYAQQSLGVGFSIEPVFLVSANASQSGFILANGSNATILIPVVYYNSGLRNITIEKPDDWNNGIGWIIEESGTDKVVTVNGEFLNWEANLSQSSVQLVFNVSSPQLFSTAILDDGLNYQHNITVSAQNPFTNVSVNIPINGSYEIYTLFWNNGTDFVNASEQYHFGIIQANATFYGFNTSDQIFIIQGSNECIESWTCSEWSACSGAFQTRTCTDSNSCNTQLLKPAISRSCQQPSSDTSSPGGAGLSPVINREQINKVVSYEIRPKSIKLSILPKQTTTFRIEIVNTGNVDLNVSANYNTQSHSLTVIASGSAELEFTTADYLSPGTYLDYVELLVDGKRHLTPVLVEVNVMHEQARFSLDIEKNEYYAGEHVNVNMLFGGITEQWHLIIQIIRPDRSVLFETQKLIFASGSLDQLIVLPQNMAPGTYALTAALTKNETAIYAGEGFIVIEQESDSSLIIAFSLILIVVLLLYRFLSHPSIGKRPHKH